MVVKSIKDDDRKNWKVIEEERNSPFNKMITAANNIRNAISNILGESLMRNLFVSNAEVAKLYCLPKMHKSGNNIRQFVDLLSVPCISISCWLVSDFKKFSNIKNFIKLANLIFSMLISEVENLVSFDVEAEALLSESNKLY